MEPPPLWPGSEGCQECEKGNLLERGTLVKTVITDEQFQSPSGLCCSENSPSVVIAMEIFVMVFHDLVMVMDPTWTVDKHW